MVEVESDHPVVLLYDPHSNMVTIPEMCSDNCVSSNETCIIVGTQHYVDGPVYVDLADSSSKETGHLLFAGKISAPSKFVAVHTAEAKSLIKFGVMANIVSVQVWVDDPSQPSKILFAVN